MSRFLVLLAIFIFGGLSLFVGFAGAGSGAEATFGSWDGMIGANDADPS